MTGNFKSKEDAIAFFKNALASKDGVILSNDLPQIDLSSEDVVKEFRELFQYLSDNGEYGYSIDELVDLNTDFDKSLLKEISDGFFSGPFASKSNTFNIEFTNTNIAGKVKVGYFPDKSLISGGLSYGKSASWYSLRLSSTTGSHMLELSLSNRDLYQHYIYSYMSMNSFKIK